MKLNIKKLQEGGDMPTYSLPEINIYPQNRFGDIARSQGINTARNWKAVKEGTTAGINEFANHPLTQGALALLPLPSGLEGAGAAVGHTAKVAKQITNPKNRAAHAYVNISPVSYRGKSKQIKGWIGDLLSGKPADVNNPKWSLELLGKDVADYIPKDVANSAEIAAKTRDDAWRIYNHITPKHDMYIKNTNGTYSYNMPRIIKMSNNTFKPIINEASVIPDYVTSAGGYVTNSLSFDRLLKSSSLRQGTQTIKDVWDLHPFSRDTDILSNRYPLLKHIPGIKNIDNKLRNLEVGSISGGKPFTMETKIPFNQHFENSRGIVTEYGLLKDRIYNPSPDLRSFKYDLYNNINFNTDFSKLLNHSNIKRP